MREGKQATEFNKLYRTSVRPAGLGPRSSSLPRPGCHRRPSDHFPSGERPLSLSGSVRVAGIQEMDPGVGELRAFSSRVAGAQSSFSLGLERRPGELASRRRASPPGLGHPSAFSVTQVQENSESLRSAEWRGGS